MSVRETGAVDFGELRPRLRVLLSLHAGAEADQALRERIERELDELLLAAAWHIASDLLENGYRPAAARPKRRRTRVRLRLVGGVDAA